MTGKDYLLTQMAMLQNAKGLAALNLDDFLKCIDNAEAIAPTIKDEKVKTQALENLAAIRSLAYECRNIKAAYERVGELVSRTTVAYMVKDAKDGKLGGPQAVPAKTERSEDHDPQGASE